jgi:hypothetical protein
VPGDGDDATVRRALASGGWLTEVVSTKGTLGVSRNAVLSLLRTQLEPGRYVYGLRMAAESNPERTLVAVSPALVVR